MTDYEYIEARKAGIIGMYNRNPEVVNGWIPITVGLPDPRFFDWVLVKYEYVDSDALCYCIARMRGSLWFDQFNAVPINQYKDKNITHWQPLPELKIAK